MHILPMDSSAFTKLEEGELSRWEGSLVDKIPMGKYITSLGTSLVNKELELHP